MMASANDLLTVELFNRALPKQLKTRVNQEMVDKVNSLMTDPVLRENYRDNLLGYTTVMMDGRFKIEDYLKAVQYVSYKLLRSTNIEAYAKTHPDRFQRLVNEGADDKTISSYAAAYNKTILVQKVFEQTLTPQHVLNADLYQKALNQQAYLMMNADSQKVQSDAANSVLLHTKPPETQKMELDLNIKQDKTVDELRDATLKLLAAQKESLINGTVSIGELAASSLNIGQEELAESVIDEQ